MFERLTNHLLMTFEKVFCKFFVIIERMFETQPIPPCRMAPDTAQQIHLIIEWWSSRRELGVEQTEKICVGYRVRNLISGPGPGRVRPMWLVLSCSQSIGSNFQTFGTINTALIKKMALLIWNKSYPCDQDLGIQSGRVSRVGFCALITWHVRVGCPFHP